MRRTIPASWQVKGIAPDIDSGGVLTQPYTIRQEDPARNIIPQDVYASRPFYFGGSNVWMYDQLANDRVVRYGGKHKIENILFLDGESHKIVDGKRVK